MTGEPIQPNVPGHTIVVPFAGGEPPYCSCGVVGGNGIDRPLLADHIAEIERPTYPNITAKDVEAKVREIAAADPDHVYARVGGVCSNIAHNGSEACLIGRALLGLGVPEALLIEKGLIEVGAQKTLRDLGISGEAVWLNEAQERQDGGEPWKVAIELADEMYPRIPA